MVARTRLTRALSHYRQIFTSGRESNPSVTITAVRREVELHSIKHDTSIWSLWTNCQRLPAVGGVRVRCWFVRSLRIAGAVVIDIHPVIPVQSPF